MHGFLRWLVPTGQARGLWAHGDIEVKRDFGERQRDEVRILTVHGAKGLEAPVVFLPDTLQLPARENSLLWSETEGLPLWRPRKDFSAPFYLAERDSLRTTKIRDIMATEPDTIEPDATLKEAAETLLENKIGCLPVVEGLHLAGILTEADFVRYYLEKV